MNADPKPSLFVVDDEPDQLLLVELAAHRSNAFGEVKAVVDSHLAYHELLERARLGQPFPDIILIDWKMPRMHGADLATALAAHEQLQGVPVIALSNSDSEVDRVRALECGCRAYYQKPASFAQLIRILQHLRETHCPTTPATSS